MAQRSASGRRDTSSVLTINCGSSSLKFALYDISRTGGRTNPDRFHVRGFTEQGTTTTTFDRVVLNGTSRYHLAMEAIRRTSVASAQARALRAEQRAIQTGVNPGANPSYASHPTPTDWECDGFVTPCARHRERVVISRQYAESADRPPMPPVLPVTDASVNWQQSHGA